MDAGGIYIGTSRVVSFINLFLRGFRAGERSGMSGISLNFSAVMMFGDPPFSLSSIPLLFGAF